MKVDDLNTIILSWKMKPLSLKVWISKHPLVSSKDFKSQAVIVCYIWIIDLFLIYEEGGGGKVLLLHQKGA